MLKGIQAFEACWGSLKQTYPTSNADSQLLVQAMGQFVDRYATTEEILQTLPSALKKIFERLVDAYSNGYNPSGSDNWAKETAGYPSASAATTETQVASTKVATAQRQAERMRRMANLAPHEMDTLIVVDLPDR
jgi:hypothetical protein